MKHMGDLNNNKNIQEPLTVRKKKNVKHSPTYSVSNFLNVHGTKIENNN